MKAHGNGRCAVLGSYFKCLCPVVRHCAGQLGTGHISGFALEYFRRSRRRVRGVRIVRVRADDWRSALVVRFDTLLQSSRGYVVARKVKLYLCDEYYLVDMVSHNIHPPK